MPKFIVTTIRIETTEIWAQTYSEAKVMVDKSAPVDWKGRKVISTQVFKDIKQEAPNA